MIRLFNAYFPKRTLLLVLTESLLISLVLIMLAFLRLGSAAGLILVYQQGYLKVSVVFLLCFLSMYFNDLYDPLIISNRREVSAKLIHGLGAACLVLALVYLTFPSSQLFQGFAIMGIALVGIALILFRQVFFAMNSFERLAEPVVVLGDGPLAVSVAREIQTRPELGLRLVGYLGKPWGSNGTGNGTQRLGAIEELRGIVDQMGVRRVIVAMGNKRNKLPIEELLCLKTSGIAIQEGSDFYEITTGKLPIDTLRMSWLVFSPGFRVSKFRLFHKSVFSLILASAALLLLSPLMLLIALAIHVDSKGPAIFRQPRIGKNGKTFTLFKFRTMYMNADLGGVPLPVQENDNRVTRVGRWLRRFRLDEIPQLYNILLGHMYFVGPRPFVPNQELELARQIPLYTQRWAVKPGATGWAQVQRGYCATIEDNREKLAYDLFYIKNLSIGLDLLILLKTVKILLLGRGGR